ncbi:MAG TPA: ATP-binding protein [Gaiellales bacterium]|jgi:signal transduction histidine kinase|nr:ATP-binding protein [Gaiellales bacterium]
MFKSTRIRLTAWYVGILAVFLIALGVALFQLEEHQLRTNADNGLRATADRVEVNVQKIGLSAAGAVYGNYIVTVSDGSPPPVDTSGHWSNRSAILAALAHGSDLRTVEHRGFTFRIYSQKLHARRLRRHAFAVQVARDLEPEEDALHGLLRNMLLGAIVCVAVAAVGGWFLAGKSLEPVAAAFARQQTFVADASHELRTPLAVIRANAEFLQQEQPGSEEAAEILAETDRLTSLVEAMLALARGQGGASAESRLDLGELVTASAQALRPLAGERKVALDVSVADGMEVRGNADQLHQLVLILVDNALRYTPEGGKVTVDARRIDGSAVVAVSDTGIGIDPDALEHVFERFYRADEARTRAFGGSGLGLSIAEQLVTEHGGRIAAESTPGRGSTFTVSLPLGPG